MEYLEKLVQSVQKFCAQWVVLCVFGALLGALIPWVFKTGNCWVAVAVECHQLAWLGNFEEMSLFELSMDFAWTGLLIVMFAYPAAKALPASFRMTFAGLVSEVTVVSEEHANGPISAASAVNDQATQATY